LAAVGARGGGGVVVTELFRRQIIPIIAAEPRPPSILKACSQHMI